MSSRIDKFKGTFGRVKEGIRSGIGFGPSRPNKPNMPFLQALGGGRDEILAKPGPSKLVRLIPRESNP